MQKVNQNSFGTYNGLRWFSTNKEVLVLTEKGIKKAAVKYERDFDFEALFKIAVGESNGN